MKQDVAAQHIQTPKPGGQTLSTSTIGVLRVATWNLNKLEADDSQRISAIASKLIHENPDLVALQEIADRQTLYKLLNPLRKHGYKGFVSRYIPYELKLAYLYNSNTVDSISAYSLPNTDSNHWAGRIPYVYHFSIRLPAKVTHLTAVNIHAKADIPSRSDSYSHRMQSAESLYRQLSRHYQQEPLLVLGDFNDDIDHSVYQLRRSPWFLFREDIFNYRIATRVLTHRSRSTTLSHDEPIDHILLSNELFDRGGSQNVRLVSPLQIDSSTTRMDTLSDHYMVTSALDLSQSSTKLETPSSSAVRSPVHNLQNYPNPLHQDTHFKFRLDRQQRISLTIYNLLGREVRQLVSNELFSKGVHHLRWLPSPDLPSGVYRYRLFTSAGKCVDRFLTIIR